MELSILNYKDFSVKISIKQCISAPEDCILACHLMWHFIKVCTVYLSTCLPVSRMFTSIQNKKGLIM